MKMSFGFWVLVLSYSFVPVSSEVEDGTVFIDGTKAIGTTEDDFICATMDWWPPEKCDYGNCSWDHASLLNLDLNNKILLNAVKAFGSLKIRLGGTLQDRVIYETPDNEQSCVPFVRNTSEIFGFTEGCLPMKRWDELNVFFMEAGVKVIFGLNALPGRSIQPGQPAMGDWNYTNAENLIRYTVEKNYPIHGWELGNELSGRGVGTRVSAEQYASDTRALKNLLHKLYKDMEPKPLVVAPAGNFDAIWYKEFIDRTTDSLDVVTHHIYNLGPGNDEHLVENILNPDYLDGVLDIFNGLQNIIKNSTASAVAWVGEAGGAYNSGCNLVSNVFLYSFWYLDQLGMASAHDTKVYCRQTLIGGNYGLLNTTTFVPNPDYYSALLWHQLMGTNVLATSFSGTNKIRSYSHCTKRSSGITVLLINLDSSTTIQTKITYNASGLETVREEYHLTAKDGDLQSQTMLLNGIALGVDSSGNIPTMEPVLVNSTEPIMVAPFSIVFVHMPDVVLPACNQGAL